jgi:tungstate transport system substrate-binding protein
MKPIGLAVLLLLGGTFLRDGAAADPSARQMIVLASTTSVENSGLLAKILPLFTQKTGVEVRVIAQGTGQALATAAGGDADLVLVHDPEAEERFMADGHGSERRQIAWNDFILVEPEHDPARLVGGHDAVAGLTAIASVRAPFVSRGDKRTDAFEKRRHDGGQRRSPTTPALLAPAETTLTMQRPWP